MQHKGTTGDDSSDAAVQDQVFVIEYLPKASMKITVIKFEDWDMQKTQFGIEDEPWRARVVVPWPWGPEAGPIPRAGIAAHGSFRPGASCRHAARSGKHGVGQRRQPCLALSAPRRGLHGREQCRPPPFGAPCCSCTLSTKPGGPSPQQSYVLWWVLGGVLVSLLLLCGGHGWRSPLIGKHQSNVRGGRQFAIRFGGWHEPCGLDPPPADQEPLKQIRNFIRDDFKKKGTATKSSP